MEFKAETVAFGRSSTFADGMKRFMESEAERFRGNDELSSAAAVDAAFEKSFRMSAEMSHEKAKDSSDPKAKEEARKAGAKTAAAKLFEAKKEVSSELAADKTTGDALHDGNTGLIRVFTGYLDPMRYVRRYVAALMAVVLPYILMFVTAASAGLTCVIFFFCIALAMNDTGTELGEFMSGFSNGSMMENSTLSEEEIDSIVDGSGAAGAQQTAVRYALSRVGYPYSQSARAGGAAYDCSSLVYYSWLDAGVDVGGAGYPPTAAEEARILNAAGMTVPASALEPGDLVFYGGSANGRYLGIYHVAMYVGNGMAVEALNEEYGVVYRNLKTKNAVMVARPG